MEIKTNHHQEHIAPVPDNSEGEAVPISCYPCNLCGQQTPAETTNGCDETTMATVNCIRRIRCDSRSLAPRLAAANRKI